MGELMILYASSQVAFVGGSLISRGGQNPLEPAALGIPVLFGHSMFNFSQISTALLQQNAAKQVADKTELAERVLIWLSNETERQQSGAYGAAFVAKNRGALQKTMELLAKLQL